MSVELKIKSKHLAFEPAIIRKEEYAIVRQMKYFREVHQTNGLDDPLYMTLRYKYDDLHRHRMWNVKNEARATYLARAYIAGKSYKQVERKTHDNSNLFIGRILPRIVEMVAKYGEPHDRIYRSWNGSRHTYIPEQYNDLMDKIYKWYKI